MKTFRTSTYSIPCAGLTGHRKVTFAVLADLHGLVFGQNHQTLYKTIIDANPDAILVAGDMVVHRSLETLEAAAGLFLRLCEIAPVFYVLGNHEYKMYLNPDTRNLYLNYEKLLTSAGICFLHNEHMAVELQGSDFVFHGLESNIITSPIPLRSVLPLWKSSSVCLRSRESTYCLHTIPNTAIRIFHGVPI